MDRVNIIMATYNGEKYIKQQINSIIKNTYTNWRLLICDDGSTDSTLSIIDEYVRTHTDKVIFHKNERNKGVTINFLEGVKRIASFKDNVIGHEYYMFCDQDDVWMEDKIEKTLKLVKKCEKKYSNQVPVAAFTDVLVVDENLNEISSSFFKSNGLNPRNTSINQIMMENKLIGCSVMFNGSLVEKLNVLPQKARFHDWWVGCIASTFGHICYLNEPTILYRQHGGNVVGNKSFSGYVKKSLLTLKAQKVTLNKTIQQAKEFYEIYEKDITYPAKRNIYLFSTLNQYNWFKKRYIILTKGFLKTGILRNIGLLIII
jgi:glycosyltransferase involved in cell wall biosynthesis